MEDNKRVVCPNCHTSSDLDQKKANSWRTMDPLESIVAGVSPVLLAAATVCTGLELRKSLSIPLDYDMAAAVFLVVIIASMPVFVWLLDRYEKKRRAIDGYEVYCVQCQCCKNVYRIVRPSRSVLEGNHVEIRTEAASSTEEST